MSGNCNKYNIANMHLDVPRRLSEIFILTDKENSAGILISGKLISMVSNYCTGILIEYFTTKQVKSIGALIFQDYYQEVELWINAMVNEGILGTSEVAPTKSVVCSKYEANTSLPIKFEGKSMKFFVDGFIEIVSVNDKKVYILTLKDSFRKYGDFSELNKFISVSNHGPYGTTISPTQRSCYVGTNCCSCCDCSVCSACCSCVLCNEANFSAGLLSFSGLLRTISISRTTSAFLSGRDTRI